MDNPFSAPTEALTRTDASLINILTEMGTSSDKSQYTMPGVSVKFSDNQLETLHEQPLINAYCSAIPDAAISKPLEFNFGSKNGDLDAKKSSEIIDWLDDFHVLEKTARAQTYANVYGGAAIVYFVDDGQPQDEPLNLKKVKKLLGTRVLDRQRVIPYIETATTLEDISHYDVSTHGVKIGIPGVAENAQIRFHKSRIVPFYGLHLTDNAMLQRYNGWGKSMIEAIWESYRDYRTAILASSGNLGDSSLAIVSMDGFIEMLRANDTETIKSVFASVKNMASNQGMMLIDKTKQDIRYVERQFTGVSQVIDKLREDFIGNSRIQHDKLFGESPSGLGATGEAEEKNWAKEVRQFQERRWRRLLRKQYEILLSLPDSPLKGKMPEQWSFKFPSIIELGEDQELANRATQSTIDSTYQSLGILTTDEIRQSRFAGSKFSYETTLDEKAYEEAKKKAEEEAAGYGGFGGGYGDFGAGAEEQAIAPEEAPAEAVPEEEAPLQTDSIGRQKRLDAMRPSCMDCVTKHLGSALIKGREVENGYPEHIILVVGELSEAEQEVEAISQEAADMIRDLRRDCWARRRSPMFEEVLAIYDVLGYDWGKEEGGDYEQEAEVPSYRNPYKEEAIDSIRNWDAASSGLPTRSLQHQDQKLEPIIDYLEEGDLLISDLPGEYWDEYQSNGEPPIIEGYECIGVTPEDCDWSYVGLEPVYRESSTVVEREDPAGEICSNEDTEENRDEDDWLLPEEIELFEIDEDPIDRILREREERERYDSRFSKSGRHKKEIRGSDGVSRTYWVKPQARVATSRQNRQELNQARRTKEARERIEAINLLDKSVTGFAKESFRDDFAMMPLETQKVIADSADKLNRMTGEGYEIVDANRSKGFVTASGDYGDCYSIGFQGGKKIVLSSEKRQLDVELNHPEFGDWQGDIEASHVVFTVNNSHTTDEPRKGDPFERKRNVAVAGVVKEMWKSQLENHFEDGEVVFCSPAWGDIEERGESREAIYKRMGFSDEVDGQDELVAVVDRTKRKGLNSDPDQIGDDIRDLASPEFEEWAAEQEADRRQQDEQDEWDERDEEYEEKSEELRSSAFRFSAIFSDTADDFVRNYVGRKGQEPSLPGLEDLHNSNFLVFEDKDLEKLSDLKDELSDIWDDLDSFEMEYDDRPFDKEDIYGEIFNHVDIVRTISQLESSSSKNKQVEMLGYVNAHIKLSAGLLPGSYLRAWDTPGNSPELQRYIEEIKKARERLAEMGVRLDNSTPKEPRQDAIPQKYAHIDFTPPESVRKAAERGLEIRAKQPKSKRGGLTNSEAAKEGIGSGVQRAVNLKNGDRLSPKVVRQMKDFFTRFAHLKGKIKQEPEGKMSQSWLQWGGDTGVTWSNKVVAQMEAADKKERQDAIARFNKKHNDSLTEETLLRQDSLNPVYEWVEGYNRGDSWVPGYVRYYRDRSGSSKKKDPLNLDAKEEDDPLAPAVEVGVGRSQGVIDRWIEILQGAIVQGGSYEEILDNLPELAKKLPLDDLGQIIQEGNIVGHLIGLSENEAT